MSRLGGAVLGCAVFLAAWVSWSADASSQSPIRIGGSVAQTGRYRLLGQNLLRGIRLCVTDANAAGGVLDRRIELRIEDDQSDPAVATAI